MSTKKRKDCKYDEDIFFLTHGNYILYLSLFYPQRENHDDFQPHLPAVALKRYLVTFFVIE